MCGGVKKKKKKMFVYVGKTEKGKAESSRGGSYRSKEADAKVGRATTIANGGGELCG